MMDADSDARYGQTTPRRYYGKYAGTVSDNGPPPDGGSHRGQVKVKVPGILEETSDGNSHQPIEVLAYPAFLPGFFFVPKNDDPVWVEFVAGDINYPIWTGVWYPDDQTPKTTDPTDPTKQGDAPTLDRKVIRSKSTGHVIELDDTSGSEALIIKDETNGNIITLSSGGIAIGATGGNVTLQFGGQSPTATVIVEDSKITLAAGDASSGSSITVDANNGITLKAPNVTVTINNGNMNVG